MARRANAATENRPTGKRTGRLFKLSGEQLAAFRAVVLEQASATMMTCGGVVQKRLGVQSCVLSMSCREGYRTQPAFNI